ncbi:hypothetical protein FACS1894182_12590 [Bacteroidia bacterium]|nr:hypothetical protein FACS1894182_12590 [Bacteroidia bacterium]
MKINVDYERQPGHGSNQWAVWIEDSEGYIVKTLFVTRFTADGGYIPRPSCTPLWVSKALPNDLSQEAIDAFSGATPSSGIQTYVWDITDADGNPVAQGNYTLMVEATLYGESEVVYKAPFTIGDKEWTLNPEPFYTSDDETNKNMIRSVNVEYLLINDKGK